MDNTTKLMQGMAKALDGALNRSGEKRHGFALFVFPLDAPEGARTNYVSNCERADMQSALAEVQARWEGRAHAAPETKQ